MGNVYVADQSNNRIRLVTPSGATSSLAGNGTGAFADGVGTEARFSMPAGVAVSVTGNVYVADQGNHRVRLVTPSGATSTLAGSGASAFANGVGTAASFAVRCFALCVLSLSIFFALSKATRAHPPR